MMNASLVRSFCPLNFSHTCSFCLFDWRLQLYAQKSLSLFLLPDLGQEGNMHPTVPRACLLPLHSHSKRQQYRLGKKKNHLCIFCCLVKKKKKNNCFLLKLSHLHLRIIIITIKSNGNLLPVIIIIIISCNKTLFVPGKLAVMVNCLFYLKFTLAKLKNNFQRIRLYITYAQLKVPHDDLTFIGSGALQNLAVSGTLSGLQLVLKSPDN